MSKVDHLNEVQPKITNKLPVMLCHLFISSLSFSDIYHNQRLHAGMIVLSVVNYAF